MKATYTPTVKTSFKTAHRKEYKLHQEYSALVPDLNYPGKARAVVTLRTYWPAQTAYACLWVHGSDIHTFGSGSAGGYGYCKESAAAAEAISNAGFELSGNISGVGTRAIEDAVLAIAAAIGRPDALLHVAHG